MDRGPDYRRALAGQRPRRRVRDQRGIDDDDDTGATRTAYVTTASTATARCTNPTDGTSGCLAASAASAWASGGSPYRCGVLRPGRAGATTTAAIRRACPAATLARSAGRASRGAAARSIVTSAAGSEIGGPVRTVGGRTTGSSTTASMGVSARAGSVAVAADLGRKG